MANEALAEPVGAVARAARGGTGTPPAAYRAMRRAVARRARLGTSLPFAVRVEGRLAGQVTVDNIVRGALRSGYLGYWIDREVAGRGMASLAVALVCDHAFGAVGLHRVQADIRPENGPASGWSSGWASSGRACCAATSTSTATGGTTSPTRCSPRTCPAACSPGGGERDTTADAAGASGARAAATRLARHTGHTTHQRHTARLPRSDLRRCITSPLRVTHVTGGVRMGSGVLLAALVVLWFVVLVPMVVTRGDAQGRPGGTGRLGPDAAAAADRGPRRPRRDRAGLGRPRPAAHQR